MRLLFLLVSQQQADSGERTADATQASPSRSQTTITTAASKGVHCNVFELTCCAHSQAVSAS